MRNQNRCSYHVWFGLSEHCLPVGSDLLMNFTRGGASDHDQDVDYWDHGRHISCNISGDRKRRSKCGQLEHDCTMYVSCRPDSAVVGFLSLSLSLSLSLTHSYYRHIYCIYV